jgi:hypothetical protein
MLVSTAVQAELLLTLAVAALFVSHAVSCRGSVMWFINQTEEVKQYREGKHLAGVFQRAAWNSCPLLPHFERVITGNSDSVIARFYDQIKSNSGSWKSATQVYEHIANNSKRFKVETILASLTGCEEGVEQFQTRYRPVLRLHSIDAYEQYISNNNKATPKPIKSLAEDLMAALKQYEKR